jgi:hypothetical protein
VKVGSTVPFAVVARAPVADDTFEEGAGIVAAYPIPGSVAALRGSGGTDSLMETG